MKQLAPRRATGAGGQEGQERSPAEWITFGVATAILLALCGLIVYDWLRPSTPPTLRIATAGEVRQVDGSFYVPFVVENTGGETAEAVQAIAELRVGSEVVETGEQLIDFLSGGEQEEGAFIFSRDPAGGASLSLRIASYKLP